MKKISKIIVFSLVVFIFTGVFGGCQKKDDGPSSTKSKSSTTQTKAKSMTSSVKKTGTKTTGKSGTAAEGEADPSEGEDDIPEEIPDDSDNQEQTIDYDGRTITIVAQTNLAPGLPMTEAEVEGTSDISKIMKYRSKLDAESLFNCKIEMKMIPIGSIVNEVINNQIAGTYLGDVLWANRQNVIPRLINNKSLLAWGDYHDFTTDELFTGEYFKNVYYYKDKFWFFSWDHRSRPDNGLHYNKGILANEGVPDLWAYADQNNWNWDSFRDIALKTTRDLNGDGITDQWGISAYAADFATTLAMTNGVAPIIFENNEAVFGFNKPESKKALLFMIQLWNVDKVVMPVLMPGGAHLRAYYGGQAAMCPSTGLAHGKAAADNGLEKNNIGFIYLPKGPDYGTYVGFTNTGGHGLYLMSSAQEPKNITKIIRYLITVYDPIRNGYGFGNDMEANDRAFNAQYVYDERSMDMVLSKSYPYVNQIDYGLNFGIALDWRNMVNKLVSNQSTVGSTLEEMTSLLTTKIEEVDSGAIF